MPLRVARKGDTVQYRNADGETQNVVVDGMQGAAPATPTSSSGTGGTLASSTTFGYKMTAVIDMAETAPSAEKTEATGVAENAVTLDWSAVTGATSYKIYGRTSGGPWGFLAEVTDLTYTDTGAATPGAAPPVTDADSIGFKGPHDRVERSSVQKATAMKQANRYYLR